MPTRVRTNHEHGFSSGRHQGKAEKTATLIIFKPTKCWTLIFWSHDVILIIIIILICLFLLYENVIQYVPAFYINKMRKAICLFDIDGTLTKSRNHIDKDMKECLRRLRQVVDIGFVGGSDAVKIRQQLDQQTIDLSHFFFSQNGLMAYKGKQLIGQQAIKDFLSESTLKRFINFCLHYIADLDIPIKRGTFIEYRTGLINVSPIGRNCSQKQRDDFDAYDKQHQIRKKFIQVLQKEFADTKLQYSIGGQISFDVFPVGWDKTYCLRYLKDYQDIYFFGDKTYPGGNDHEIYQLVNKKEGRAFSITKGPQQTIQILTNLFLKQEEN